MAAPQGDFPQAYTGKHTEAPSTTPTGISVHNVKGIEASDSGAVLWDKCYVLV